MTTIPLSPVEEGFAALAIRECETAIAAAETLKQSRLNILLKEKGVPDGVQANVTARTTTDPASITYEEPA